MDWKLELVTIPVTDVDRAKAFYTEKAGFNADHDHHVSDELRFVQLTPPGSACSIAFGTGLSESEPGSAQVQLVVADVHAAREELIGRGLDVGEVEDFPGDRSCSSATPTATTGPCSSCRRGRRRRAAVATAAKDADRGAPLVARDRARTYAGANDVRSMSITSCWASSAASSSPRRREEAVRDAAEANAFDRHPGRPQAIGVELALVAKRIVPGGDDERRRQTCEPSARSGAASGFAASSSRAR